MTKIEIINDEESRIKQLIIDGKVDLNKVINAVVSTIVAIPVKKGRTYKKVKEERATKKKGVQRTLEEKRAYAREYYEKNKDKFKDNYKKNRDILNENGKKYYKLKKLKKLVALSKEPLSVSSAVELTTEPSTAVRPSE
jgi:hypothetical protein